jgi:hypothetical protein
VSKATEAISIAQSQIGKPYSYGAEGPSAFDCSGLVQWVYSHVGITLPRTAAAQQGATTPTGKPRPGDLVFYGNPAHHVAIYIGAGKQIAAPHTGAKVQIQDVYSGVSNYGRVSGSGALASAGDALTATNASLFSDGGFTTGLVDGAKDVSIKLAAVVFGLALVGFGAYRSFGQKISSQVKGALS